MTKRVCITVRRSDTLLRPKRWRWTATSMETNDDLAVSVRGFLTDGEAIAHAKALIEGRLTGELEIKRARFARRNQRFRWYHRDHDGVTYNARSSEGYAHKPYTEQIGMALTTGEYQIADIRRLQ